MKSVIITLFLAVAIVLAGVPSVGAALSFDFTSTADFDEGDKRDGTDWFVTDSVDQSVYGYITDPTAVHVSRVDRTYVAYHATLDGLPYVTYYDHNAKSWANPVAVAATNPVGTDSHGSPSILVDAEGYIFVFYGSHITAQKAVRSANPYSISNWVVLPDPDNQATYPNPLEYNGVIYLFFREGGGQPGNWVYRTSSNNGASWSARSNLITMTIGGNATDGQYTGGWNRLGTRVYWTWVKVDGAGLRTNVYVCYWDLVSHNWFNVSGTTNLGPTVTQTEANTDCRAWETVGPGATANWARSSVLANGNVYTVFGEGFDSGTNHEWTTNFTWYNGTSWSTAETVVEADASSHFAEIEAFSQSNVEIFATTPGVVTGCSGDCEFGGDIEQWRWNGVTWTKVATIYSEVKANMPLDFPFVIDSYDPELRLLFGEFGSIISGPNFQRARIYAWGSNGLVKNTANLLPSTVTSSDESITAGEFRTLTLGSDTFSVSQDDLLSVGTRNWRFFQEGDGNADCDMTIANGIWSVAWSETGGGTGSKVCLGVGTWALSGDFDVNAHFAITTGLPDSDSENVALCITDVPSRCPSSLYATADGYWVRCVRTANGADDGFISTFEIDDGVGTQDGTTTSDTSDCFDIYLRITRVGNLWSSYFGTNGVNWTLDESETIAADSLSYVHFAFNPLQVETGTETATLTSLTVESGDVTPQYIESARWTSAQFEVPDQEKVTSVVITHDVSTDAFIDSVELLQDDSVTFASGTDRTTEDSTNVTVSSSSDVNGNVKVRVRFAGDGESTASVQDITIYTLRSLTGVLVDGGRVSLFFILLGAMVGVAFIIARRRRED